MKSRLEGRIKDVEIQHDLATENQFASDFGSNDHTYWTRKRAQLEGELLGLRYALDILLA